MIEIVFGDSAAGSLKQAQHFGKGEYHGGAIGVILSSSDGSKPTKEEIEQAKRRAEERARKEWEQAVPMGGNPADVFPISLALSIGYIGKDALEFRRPILERLFSIYPSNERDGLAGRLLQQVQDNLDVVIRRAVEGESLRIWYSDNPDECCGLYWMMAQISRLKSTGPVYVVKLPAWSYTENRQIIRMTGWGDVSPGEWSRYTELQQPASKVFIAGCAAHWSTLQKEGATLRAVVNGQLLSVPENFYDSFILREIAAQPEEFMEAQLIGNVLGKYQLGIGDAWVALRIEEMICAGELTVLSQPPADTPIYHRMISKK